MFLFVITNVWIKKLSATDPRLLDDECHEKEMSEKLLPWDRLTSCHKKALHRVRVSDETIRVVYRWAVLNSDNIKEWKNCIGEPICFP